MSIRLLIAEDHDLVREALRVTFQNTDIAVVAKATGGHEAVRLAEPPIASDNTFRSDTPLGRPGFLVPHVLGLSPYCPGGFRHAKKGCIPDLQRIVGYGKIRPS